MRKMFAIYLITIFGVCVLARPNFNVEMDEGQDEPILYKNSDLINATKKFRCGPQQRSYLVSENLDNHVIETTEDTYPKFIVLHKCDVHSGCCQMKGEVCAPTKTRKVIFQISVKNRLKKGSRIIEIERFDHTECECQKTESPKRNKSHDARVQSLTSTGLTNYPNEHLILLCVASILYIIYLPLFSL